MSSHFQQCPACGGDRLLLQEGFSQCFSLGCGLRRPTAELKGIDRILQFIYEEAHQCLLSDPAGCVYRNLTEGRGLLPSVIAHTMVGVVEADLDVSGQLRTAIEEADARVDAAKPQGRGRPTKDERLALAAATKHAQRLREFGKELTTALDAHNGDLVCFFTSPEHVVVRVAFYGAGLIRTLGTGGLFEHALFPAFDPPEGLLHRRERYVVEQEFELLQLQSLSATIAMERGHRPEAGYLRACATGASFDAGEVRRLGRTPIAICGESGRPFVEQLRQEVNLTACFAGGPVDAYIRQSQTANAAHDAITALIGQRTLFTRPFERVREEIDDARTVSGAAPFEKWRWAGERITHDLRERAHLYWDGRVAHVFLHDTKEVVSVDVDGQNFQLLMREYGVAATDRDMFRHIIQSLSMTALQDGTRATVSSMVRYIRQRHTLYVFDHGATVYRIRPSGVDRVENGTDGMLFVRSPKWQPFKVDLDTRPDFHRLPVLLLGAVRLKDVGLSRQDVEMLLHLWVLVMFFPELFPTKVILALVGVAGSGKTSILKLLGRLLFGLEFAVSDITDDMRDLDAAITSEPFVAIDNADRRIKGLDDKLAVAATGGTLKRRLYYTTNQLAEFPITATLGITSRTPHFRREDISDRLLPVMLDRFETFGAFGRIQDEMAAQRDEIMSVLIANLRVVVAELQLQEDWSPRTTFRMADFGEFALKIGPILGCDDPEAVLGRLAALQEQFTVEDDPLFAYLDEWLHVGGNRDRFVSTRELFEELRVQEAENQRSFEVKGVKELGHALSDLRATLQRAYGMEERTGRSRSREVRFRHSRIVNETAA
jgi:hypothetical protein